MRKVRILAWCTSTVLSVGMLYSVHAKPVAKKYLQQCKAAIGADVPSFKCSDGKIVKLTKWALFFIKHLIVEFYSHATLPYTLTAAFVKNEDTIGMSYNTNFIALFTSKVFWGFH